MISGGCTNHTVHTSGRSGWIRGRGGAAAAAAGLPPFTLLINSARLHGQPIDTFTHKSPLHPESWLGEIKTPDGNTGEHVKGYWVKLVDLRSSTDKWKKLR